MTNNFFEPQEVNLQVQPLPTYIDSDGVFKINTPMLATYNFDGLIPKYDGAISASAVKPGYLIQLDTGGQYYPVVSVESDDDVLESTGLVTINYIDDLGNTNSESYGETDEVNVIYENWAEKIVGSQGWGITSGGNAIFTNVAVRGRIEADEGYISGNLTIGSGGSETLNDLATTADLNGYIPDGAAAADIISNGTTITGGNIFTGTIQSQFYSYTSGLYSNNGMQIGLDGNGYIRGKNFYIDTSGNANFRGNVVAKSIEVDATDTSNPAKIVGSEVGIGNGLVSNIAFSFNTGKNTFSHNGSSWTVDSNINFSSLIRDQLYNFPGSNPFRMLTLRSGNLINNNTATTISGAAIDLVTYSNSSQLVLNADLVQSFGNFLHQGALYVAPSNTLISSYPPAGTIQATSFIGNLQGNATNISQYLINQNLGVGSNVQFNSVIGPQSIEMRQIAVQGAAPTVPAGNYRGGTLWIVV